MQLTNARQCIVADGQLSIDWVKLNLELVSIQPPFDLFFLPRIHYTQMMTKSNNSALLIASQELCFIVAYIYTHTYTYTCSMGGTSCQWACVCINAAESYSKVYTYIWKHFSHLKGKLDSGVEQWEVFLTWLQLTDKMVVARCNGPVRE